MGSEIVEAWAGAAETGTNVPTYIYNLNPIITNVTLSSLKSYIAHQCSQYWKYRHVDRFTRPRRNPHSLTISGITIISAIL